VASDSATRIREELRAGTFAAGGRLSDRESNEPDEAIIEMKILSVSAHEHDSASANIMGRRVRRARFDNTLDNVTTAPSKNMELSYLLSSIYWNHQEVLFPTS
jgi:hypothetical protein